MKVKLEDKLDEIEEALHCRDCEMRVSFNPVVEDRVRLKGLIAIEMCKRALESRKSCKA
jgi:hypothetical protein